MIDGLMDPRGQTLNLVHSPFFFELRQFFFRTFRFARRFDVENLLGETDLLENELTQFQ